MCALIVPWNFPLLIASWKVAPALACGNPIVLKPASLTPLTALAARRHPRRGGRAARVRARAARARARVVGDALVGDPRVAKVGFTGETATGAVDPAGVGRQHHPGVARARAASRPASCSPTPTSNAAVERDARCRCSRNAGQDCCARSRILVERTVYDEFVAALRRAHRSRSRSGAPLDEATEMGPMISAGQRQHVARLPRASAREGGRDAWCAAARCPIGPGFYLTPAVVADVDNDDAHRPRGDLRSGGVGHPLRRRGRRRPHRQRQRLRPLRLAVDRRRATRAIRVAAALRTGTLSVNTNRSVRFETPFGGFKRSGLGRELGMAAMDTYTEVKNVFFSADG